MIVSYEAVLLTIIFDDRCKDQEKKSKIETEISQWHSLSREEQSIYYEKARQERQLHMELYPGWSARDNYGYGSKKKKRKKDRSPADSGGIIHCFVLFIPFLIIYYKQTKREKKQTFPSFPSLRAFLKAWKIFFYLLFTFLFSLTYGLNF